MAVTSNTYTGDGSNKLFSITFPYLDTSDIDVSLNGSLQTITTQYTFANATTIEFVIAPAIGAEVLLNRSTDDTSLQATFFPGSSIKANDLNFNFDQVLYLSQETANIAANQSTAGLQAQITAANNAANSAVSTANTANTTANTANTTANGIAATASSAVTTANSAVTTANSAVTTANAATVTANQALATVGSSQRNAIINGDFDIWQRGTSFTASNYGSDRWIHARVGSTQVVTRQAFTLGQTAVPNEPSFYVNTVVTSVAGASNYVVMTQRIEDVRTFAGQQVTLSFWAKAGATRSIAVDLTQNFGTGGSPSAEVVGLGVTKVVIGTSWQKITVTTTLPSLAGKTLGTNQDNFITVNIWYEAGSTFNSRTNTLGHQSGSFDIAQVQLEAGATATTFEARVREREQALCQRYFYSPQITTNWAGTAAYAGVVLYAHSFYPVTMRTTPTVVASWGSGVNASAGAITANRHNIEGLLGAVTTGQNFSAVLTFTSVSAEL